MPPGDEDFSTCSCSYGVPILDGMQEMKDAFIAKKIYYALIRILNDEMGIPVGESRPHIEDFSNDNDRITGLARVIADDIRSGGNFGRSQIQKWERAQVIP
ncbi:MAG: hypothetical protein V1690_02160 [Candidatus Moraniibacteriota bacterium]